MQLAVLGLIIATAVAAAPIDEFMTALDHAFTSDTIPQDSVSIMDEFLVSSANLPNSPPSSTNAKISSFSTTNESPSCDSLSGGCLLASGETAFSAPTPDSQMPADRYDGPNYVVAGQAEFLKRKTTLFICDKPEPTLSTPVDCIACPGSQKCPANNPKCDNLSCLTYKAQCDNYGQNCNFCSADFPTSCTRLGGHLSHFRSQANKYGQIWCRDCHQENKSQYFDVCIGSEIDRPWCLRDQFKTPDPELDPE